MLTGADVVVHLAFMIMGGTRETTEINLAGSRNVFSAAVDAGVTRLVYASSVAAYGFGADNPPVLTEDLEPRGTQRHYYSAQKAELELALRELLAGSGVAAYVFRPCIVAGPDALTLVRSIPYVQLSERMPGPVLRALELVPALRPVIPDPGVPFQLVHHDDVATALRGGGPGSRASRGSTTWPATARSPWPTSPMPLAGTASRCPTWPSTPPPSSSPACPSCPARPSGSRACAGR